ncbi:MAG TPA: hypothetical protein VL137_10855 [Polyangiaceae bacterium]|nr:hypothetical protein [Polyangiaceae bacterium]
MRQEQTMNSMERKYRLTKSSVLGLLLLACAQNASQQAKPQATASGGDPSIGSGATEPAPMPEAALGASGERSTDAQSAQGGAASIAQGGAVSSSVAPAADAATSPAADASTDAGPRRLRALQIALGRYHACALLEDHSVKCWGMNGYGQLGCGDMTDRGTTADEMGDNLPRVDLGAGHTARSIAAGRYSSCAILDDESLKCWGYNQGFSTDDAGVYQQGGQPRPVEVGPGRKVKYVAQTIYMGCAVLDNDSARCWGTPEPFYDLPKAGQIRQISGIGNALLVLFNDGTLDTVPPGHLYEHPTQGLMATAIGGSAWGYCGVLGKDGVACTQQIDSYAVLRNVSQIGLGDTRNDANCALMIDGSVRCPQWNLSGCNPAVPGASYWCDPATSAAALGAKAVSIGSGGVRFTCALLENGAVRCWGGDSICATDAGWVPCDFPSAPVPELGGSIEIKNVGGVRSYGTWHAIDLGTAP